MTGGYRAALLGLALLAATMTASLAAERPDYSELSSDALEALFFERLMNDGEIAHSDMHDLRGTPEFGAIVTRRFACLASNASGNADRSWDFVRDLYAFLSGPPDALQLIDERYVAGSACRAHSCNEKAIVIADLDQLWLAFGLLHYFPWAPASPEYWNAPRSRDGYISIFVEPEMDMARLDDIARIVTDWAEAFVGDRRRLQDVPQIDFYAIDCEEYRQED